MFNLDQKAKFGDGRDRENLKDTIGLGVLIIVITAALLWGSILEG